MSEKNLSDYINWRNKPPVPPEKNEYRPPVHTRDYMYDKPQTKILSSLDNHPIIQRVLINPRTPAPRSFPLWGTKGYQFFAGVWTGAMVCFIFTCKPLGRKETEDLVKFDPAYFPEIAKSRMG